MKDLLFPNSEPMKNVLQTLIYLGFIIVFGGQVVNGQVTFSISPNMVDTTSGSSVCLDVEVQGFNSLVSAQYSINYDETVLAFNSTQNLNLNNLQNSNIANPAPGAITFSWLSDDLAVGTSVADGTSIYQICFDVIGASMTESDLDFSGTPTAIEVADAAGSIVPFSGNPGLVTVDGGSTGGNPPSGFTIELPDVTADTGDNICVDVTTYNFDSIVSAQFSINYEDANLSYTGVQNINLANLQTSGIGNPSAGNITVSWLSDDLAAGTSVSDGTSLFQLCFDVLGSDVTTPLSVSDTPTPIEISDASGMILPLNNIDGSVIIGTGGGGGGGNPPSGFTIELPDVTADTGDNICVDVTTFNFTDIISMQFSINYESANLSYTGSQNINLANLQASGIGNPSAGNITVSWLSDDLAAGTSVSDGTSLFQLCFDVLGSDVTTPLSVSDTPTPIEVSDASGMIVPLNGIDGSVEIGTGGGGGGGGNPPSGFTIELPDVTADTGDNICVDVTTFNFTDIISMQFSINYESANLSYTGSQNINLANLQASGIGNPSAGNITVSWLSDDLAAGTSVSDGTSLFQLCFDVLGSDVTTPLSVSDTPTPIEVSDASGMIVPLNGIDGSVEIGTGGGGGGGGNPPSGFTIELPDVTADTGDNICVDVTTFNFTDIISMQFSINYESANLSYTGSQNINLANLQASGIGNPSAGNITVSWLSDDLAAGTSVSDGTSLFQLCFDVLGSDVTTPLSVSDTPTPIEVSDASGMIVPLNGIDGSVEIGTGGGGGGGNPPSGFTIELPDVTADTGDNICVDVTTFNFTDIISMQFSINYESANLSYTGSQNINLANLQASGIGNPSAGNITVSWLSDDLAAGTSVSDGTSLFQLCFDVLGSDVTTPLSVSDTPTPIEVSDASGMIVPLNGIDGSVEIGTGGGGGGGNPPSGFTIELPDVTADTGDNICVDVTTFNFTDIISMQFSINYESANLSYTGSQNINLANLQASGIGNPSAGNITVSWLSDDLAAGTSVSDGTSLFQLCFDVLGSDVTTPLSVSDTPTPIEVSDASGMIVPLNGIDGSVEIGTGGGGGGGNPPSGFTIELPDVTADTGDNICVDVTTFNFTDIISMQFSINYESANLSYTGSQNINLANLQASGIGNPSAGNITVSWLSDDLAAGTSVSDGTSLFQLCFDVLGSDVTTPLSVSDTPTPIEVSDASGMIVPLNGIDGSVEIGTGGGGGGGNPPSGFTIELPDVTADTGDNICVDVTTFNFTDIISMQFSINYESANLSYTGSQNINLANLQASGIGNPSAGNITVSWLSDDLAAGTSVSDGTSLFQLCFDVLGSDVTTPLTVSDTPTPIEVSDASGMIVPLNGIDGSLAIGDGGTGGNGGGNPPSGFTIELPEVTAGTGDNICVDVTTYNFTEIVSAQFSINYEGSNLEYTGVDNLNLDNLQPSNIGNPTAGVISFSWITNDFSNGTSVVDGTSIFQLCFDVLGSDVTTPIGVSGSPTPIEVSDAGGNIIPLNNIDGSVEIGTGGGGGGGGNPPSGFTIELPEVTADTGDNICVDVTTYNFTEIVSAQFSINYEGSNLEYTGVDNLNLDNLQPSNIGNPTAGVISFSWITNDFSNGTSVVDGTSIFQLCFDVLGSDVTTPIGVSGSPTPIEVSDAGGNIIPLNNIDGSVEIGTGGGGGGNPPSGFTIELPDVTADTGDNICVDVTTYNFTEIVSAQFSINYEGSNLEYTGVDNLNLDNLQPSNIGNPTAGVISFSWITNDFSNGTSVVDGTSIFQLCFDVLGSDVTTPIGVSGSPTPIEVSDAGGSIIPLNNIDGSVEIGTGGGGGGGNPPSGFTIELPEVTADTGDNICVDVTTYNFTEIVSAQFSINYEGSNLEYTGVDNLNLDNLQPSNIGNPTAGVISFSWITNDFSNGTSVVDGTSIFQLCFDVLGSDVTTPIGVSGSPTPIEVSDAGGNIIPLNNIDGSVEIGTGGGGGGGNPPSGFTIELPEVTADTGDNICVDVTTYNFTEIVSAQFSINYEGSNLEYTGVDNLNLDNLQPSNIGNPTAGVISFSWITNDFSNGTSVVDGTSIFQLCFDVLGSDVTTPIGVSGSPTPIEVSDAGGSIIPLNNIDGSVEIGTGGGGGGNPPSGFTIELPEVTADTGDNICLDVTTYNFTEIVSAQFSINYEGSNLMYTGVDNLNLDNLQPSNIGNPTAGVIGFSWITNDFSNGTTVVDGTSIFQLCFDVLGSDVTTPIGVSGSPTPIEISNSLGNILPLNNIDGSVTIGNVTGPTDALTFILPELSGEPGDIVCADITVENFVNIVSSQFSINYDSEILNFSSFEFPTFTSPAMNAANPSDGLLNIIFAANDPGLGATVPDGTAYVSVCFELVGDPGDVSDLIIPTSVPPGLVIEVSDNNGLIDPILDNGSITILNGTGPLTIELEASEHIVQEGTDVCVSISSEAFTDLTSLDFDITFNESILQYIGSDNIELSGLNPTDITNASSGLITVSWMNAATNFAGGNLFDLCFTVIGNPGDISDIAFSNEIGQDSNGSLDFDNTDGFVQVDSAIDGFALIISNENVESGESFCLDVSVNDFIALNSMQFTINFDTTMLTLDNINTMNLAGLGANNVNYTGDGNIALTWNTDNGAAGTTLGNGTTILELCFTAVGSNCSDTNVSFTNTPVPIEILDNAFNFITLQSFGGDVTICNIDPLVIEFNDLEIPDCEFESACIPVTVENFDGIVSMEYRISFDPTIMTNISFGNFGITDLGQTNFNVLGNEIILSYASPDPASGEILADGGVLFELCFDLAGQVGDETTVEIDESQLVEITNNGGTFVYPPSLLDLSGGDIEVVVCCPEIFVSAATEGTCTTDNNGTINLDVSGGDGDFTFIWSNNEITEDIEDLAPGVYTVTVSSCNNSSSEILSAEVIGFQSPVINSAIVTEVSCNGGADGCIELDLSDASNISWTGPISVPDTATICDLVVGDYTVVLESADGCLASMTYTIIEPDALTISHIVQANTGGNNGSIDLTVVGGSPSYTFNWTGPNGEVFSSEDINNLIGGEYCVVVTDSRGCIIDTCIDVPAPVEINVSSVTNVCNGVDGDIAIDILSGVPDFTITLSLNNGIVETLSQSDLESVVFTVSQAGVYVIEITDTFGNTDTETVTILAPSPIVLNSTISGTSGFGCDGSILIVPSGGEASNLNDYTISWSNSETSSFIDELCEGTYEVTVTDLAGCSIVQSFTVNCEPAILDINQENGVDVLCHGDASGSWTIELSGGNGPYTFELFDGDGNDITPNDNIDNDGVFTFSGLLAGNYSMNVTDDSPCMIQTVSSTVSIGQPDPIAVDIITISPASCPAENGSVDIEVTGGNPIYNYFWEFDSNLEDPDNIAAGTYTLSVQDSEGCLDIFNDLVDIPCFEVSDVLTQNPNCSNDTGELSVLVSGGINQPLTYEVSGPNGYFESSLNNVFVDLVTGVYTIVVTDANGLVTLAYTTTVSSTSNLNGFFESTSDYNGFDVSCFDSTDGEVELMSTGGFNSMNFFNCDSTAVQPSDITNLGAGNHCFFVQDELGCIDTIDVNLSSPEQITAEVLVEGLDCFGDNNGMVNLLMNGGFGEFTFQWDAAAGDQQTNPALNLVPGAYSVEIMDDNACTVIQTIELVEPDSIFLDFVLVPSETDDFPCTGAVAAEVSGGTSPYNYEWSIDGDEFVINDLCPDEYYLTVTDANGCTIEGSAIVRNGNDQCLSYRNVITPNGDQDNEFFYLHCVEDFADNSLEVYNRWGHLVYQANNYSNEWNGFDGTTGENLPEGGYFFVFKYFESGSTELSQLKGHITIIRE